MNQIEKQQSNVEGLLELIKENPNLEIMPMVDYEVCASDDFSKWLGSWGTAKIDEFYVPEYDEERIYFKSTDEEKLGDKIFDHLEDNNPSWSDTYLQEQTEKVLLEVEWEKVIVVNINIPDRW
jgi:hypothetical protein